MCLGSLVSGIVGNATDKEDDEDDDPNDNASDGASGKGGVDIVDGCHCTVGNLVKVGVAGDLNL